MDHVISTGADGRLDGMGAADVKALVAAAVDSERIVLHFHGGLVSREKGENVARMLAPVYEEAGATPIFFVWQAGAVEIIRHNLLEIAREELFERLLRRVLAWSVGKVRDVAGGRPGLSTSLPRDNEVAAQLGQRRRDVDPEAGTEPYETLEPRPGTELTEDEEEAFVEDVASDQGLEDALMGAMADRGLAATGPDGGRGVPDVPPQPSLMDDDVLAEVAEGTAEGARGLFSTVALARRALKVLRAVLARYDLETDHGVYPTVVEELLREFYLASVGGALWAAMKKETADTFEGADDRGGRVLLDALAELLPEDGSRPITLVGHSTGAVFIDHFLTDVLRRDARGEKTLPAGQKFQVVFLAPAATTGHFVDALGSEPDWLGRSRIGRFRMFTMTDHAEQADRLVGAVYPRSLLFLVSGLLERDAEDRSALLPLVGLSRYLGEGRDKFLGSTSGKSARLADLRAYLEEKDLVVLSPTAEDAPAGARASATSHGDFDNDPLVQESLRELIRRW